MKITTAAILAAVTVAAGCSTYDPQTIAQRVDPISISDWGAYQSDLETCAGFAQQKQEQEQGKAVAMALLGAALGAGLGAAVAPGGYHGYGARVGALSGAASGTAGSAARGAGQLDALVINCMTNRGYAMLY